MGDVQNTAEIHYLHRNLCAAKERAHFWAQVGKYPPFAFFGNSESGRLLLHENLAPRFSEAPELFIEGGPLSFAAQAWGPGNSGLPKNAKNATRSSLAPSFSRRDTQNYRSAKGPKRGGRIQYDGSKKVV